MLRSCRVAVGIVAVAGCSAHSGFNIDASEPQDASFLPAEGGTGATTDAGLPYRHTIMVDGNNDFTLQEEFTTTLGSYNAGIAWDADNVYIGYGGEDIAGTTSNPDSKWVFVYVDADPGASTGSLNSQAYNTQHASFPTGFGAEFYVRWKCDNTFNSIQTYSNGAWTTSTTAPTIARAGSFVEIAFPRSLLGSSTTAGIITYMINEKDNAESSYAGLYTGNFANGYAANLEITKYLRADFTSARVPDDPANTAP